MATGENPRARVGTRDVAQRLAWTHLTRIITARHGGCLAGWGVSGPLRYLVWFSHQAVASQRLGVFYPVAIPEALCRGARSGGSEDNSKRAVLGGQDRWRLPPRQALGLVRFAELGINVGRSRLPRSAADWLDRPVPWRIGKNGNIRTSRPHLRQWRSAFRKLGQDPNYFFFSFAQVSFQRHGPG